MGIIHRGILLTEALVLWLWGLRFFTSIMVLCGVDVAGVWTEDLWHHLSLGRGEQSQTWILYLPLKWTPSDLRLSSHSFKLPIPEGKCTPIKALQRILSSSFCETERCRWLLLVHRSGIVMVRLTRYWRKDQKLSCPGSKSSSR